MAALKQPPPAGNPEELPYKNRLLQYSQRASIPLPEYRTFIGGNVHALQFITQVWVDGEWFTSPSAFPDVKMSEEDAAKHALIGILERIKNEGHSRLLKDPRRCKSMISNYASKMKMKNPAYVTWETRPGRFVSTLVLDGVNYIGEFGSNKKEAQSLAARSAVLSILDSESAPTMYVMLKSNLKPFDAMEKAKDSSNREGGNVAACLKPAKDSTSEQPCNTQANCQSTHEIKKPKPETSSAEMVAPLIEFLPPSSEQPLTSSTYGKKHKHGKKTAEKKAQCPDSQHAVKVSTSEQPCNTQATEPSPHELQVEEPETSSAVIAPLTEFVPPAMERPQTSSIFGKKRSGGKKKAIKKAKCPDHQHAVTESASEQPCNTQATEPSPNELQVEEPGTSSAIIARLTEFVPPVLEQPQTSSTSGKRQHAVTESTSEQPCNAQATDISPHELQMEKPDTSSALIAPLIEFAPPALQQPQTSSTSGKKRSRSGKKKAKKEVLCPDSQHAVAESTSGQPCKTQATEPSPNEVQVEESSAVIAPNTQATAPFPNEVQVEEPETSSAVIAPLIEFVPPALEQPETSSTSGKKQHAVTESSSEQPCKTQATDPSPHLLQMERPETSSAVIAPLIEFLPQALQQPQTSSTSGQKRKRGGKKKAKKKAQCPDSQLAVPDSTSEQPCNTQATEPSPHELQMEKPETSSAVIAPLIEFVPPALEGPQTSSTSGKKLTHRGKRAKKKARCPDPQHAASEPTSEQLCNAVATDQSPHEFQKVKPETSFAESTLEQPGNTQTTDQSPHDFQKEKPEASSAEIDHLIAYVPPDQYPGSQPAASVCTSEQPSNTHATNQFPHDSGMEKLETSSAEARPVEFVPPALEQRLTSSTSGKKA